MAGDERGEYRPIFVALVHGPDFLALSRGAKALWYPVKLALGALGISPVPAAIHTFAEQTGFSAPEVEAAKDELITAAWLQVEGNVWWMVRGLDFEPQLDSANRNHRVFVYREWSKLPNLKIRADFRRRYGSWFEGEGMTFDSPSKALPITNPSPAPAPSPSPNRSSALAPNVMATIATNTGMSANPHLASGYRELVSSHGVQQVQDWLAEGIDIWLIVDTIESVARKFVPSAGRTQPSTLKYFDRPVRQAHAAARDIPALAVPKSGKPAPFVRTLA